MDDYEEKYYEDQSFRALVDMLFHLIHSNKYKAHEVLDAAEMAYLKNQNILKLKENLDTPKKY
jgi:hypothetical protein